MRYLPLDKFQTDVMDHEGGGTFYRVNTKAIHHLVWLPEAFYDPMNEVLLLINQDPKTAQKLLYYTGNEHDAKLEMYYKGLIVYSDVQIRDGYLDKTEEYDTPCFEDDDGELTA